jgi:lysophospholipase L1-like esterase
MDGKNMARRRFNANVVTWWNLDSDATIPSEDPALHDQLILAEGDSWFTLGGIPTSNLLFSLRFVKSTLVVSCAMPGDTIRHMSEVANNKGFRDALSRRYGYRWNLILLSGGGNDLMDEADEILRPMEEWASVDNREPKDYCNEASLGELMANIQAGYQRMVALRDGPGASSPKVPMLTHTYDYPTPRNAPARFLSSPILGPWLFKAFTAHEIPESDWVPLSDYLLDRLAITILDLAQGPNALPQFHVLDTRNLLKRARLGTLGEDGDWLNEIHPTFDGYRKIAKAMEETIQTTIAHP